MTPGGYWDLNQGSFLLANHLHILGKLQKLTACLTGYGNSQKEEKKSFKVTFWKEEVQVPGKN